MEDEGGVAFYKDATPMAVLPAGPFISRASYPTPLPTRPPGNTHHAANDLEAVVSRTAKDGMSEGANTVAFVMKCAGKFWRKRAAIRDTAVGTSRF